MFKYFTREKYTTNILSKTFYTQWVSENPQYKDVSFIEYKKIWKDSCQEMYAALIENPSGVDLPLFLGNFSVKVLDIDFTCGKDFPSTTVYHEGSVKRLPYITTDIPKKIKITWKKHELFKHPATLLAVENTQQFKKAVSAGVRGNVHKYEKAYKFDKTPSKCEEEVVIEKSIFE